MFSTKHNKTIRIRNGVREALFGGYVAKYHKTRKDDYGLPLYLGEREVQIWAPASIADDDCGAGTNEICKRLAAKAGVPVRNVRESWRY
jgi:hypothetical protein